MKIQNLLINCTIIGLIFFLASCQQTAPRVQKESEIKMLIDYKKNIGKFYALTSNKKTLFTTNIEEIPLLCKRLSVDSKPINIQIVSEVMLTSEDEKAIKEILKENSIIIKSFYIPNNMEL